MDQGDAPLGARLTVIVARCLISVERERLRNSLLSFGIFVPGAKEYRHAYSFHPENTIKPTVAGI
jgi:hypothetical protein